MLSPTRPAATCPATSISESRTNESQIHIDCESGRRSGRRNSSLLAAIPEDRRPKTENVRFIEAGWTSRPSDSSNPLYFRTELANAEELTFSGNQSPHSSLYMEAKASAGWPVVFYEEFEYESCAEWIPLGITDDDTETGIAPSGKRALHRKNIRRSAIRTYCSRRESWNSETPCAKALTNLSSRRKPSMIGLTQTSHGRQRASIRQSRTFRNMSSTTDTETAARSAFFHNSLQVSRYPGQIPERIHDASGQ